MPLLFILLFFIVNVLIYFKSSRWRKQQQHLYVQSFTFLIDYYIFIIPITVLVFVLALPGIFITGNSTLDTIMTNIFIIEMYLFSLPVLLLWNSYMVYPNLQFLCSLYDKKILNYEVLKRSTLCLEVILCCILIPSIHYISIIFLIGVSLFLEYKMADDS
ncbi:hypothetical protein [Bacillus paranthracis]|uniref:hypothetical protein n=1 Tax=Bacillus paranthracis TaxID=2026186 RepID=UPI0039A21116